MPNFEKVLVTSVGDVDLRALITLVFHQHSKEHETEEGGGQYAALLHSVCHCGCFGYHLVVSDARRHPVMNLTHHVCELLRTAEFLHELPQSIAIYRVKVFRQIHEGSVDVTVQMTENDTGKDHPGDVERRDAFVIPTELAVPLPLVEMTQGRVFEILRNSPLAPHLLE
ncbi:unnamed protein product [Schistocephalus solidus]|uniref:HORMA domain-containing protein n=1 Tax=Schistocephalus solidus TaxID=70667 RepID=A0A183TAE6_SCHSO|nr:unnamed protein product [Schistocephalus solidus]